MKAALDHPIVFTFFVALVVAFWFAIFRWGAKAANLPGAANLFGG